LKYILAILTRWKTEGKGTTKKTGKDAKPTATKRAGYNSIEAVMSNDPAKIAEISRRRKEKQSGADKFGVIDKVLGGP
jgi:hypothetical protein